MPITGSRPMTDEERSAAFDEKWVKDEKGCWLWKGGKGSTGYGVFWTGSNYISAHRWAYIRLNGPIDSSLDMDHLCRVRACVNPAHLEPVTRQENLRRGHGTNGHRASVDVCQFGHSDWYVFGPTPSRPTGGRRCRICTAKRAPKYW
jgi:hypothetical protein